MILLIYSSKQKQTRKRESDLLGCSADPKFEVVKQKESLSQRD